MSTPPEPPPRDRAAESGRQPGRHGLGPHVVGQRIVVRRVVRGELGPSGGPALTDVLGICRLWADGRCVVEREDGDRIEIATADIVSGKPVPPRPSPRLRVEAGQAQRRAMRLFADLETEQLGEWVLRYSPTQTARRANSVLAMDPVDDLDTAYEAVVAFYDARDRRPIAAVLEGSAAAEFFLARGWVPESADPATIFAMVGVAAARRALRGLGSGAVAERSVAGDRVRVRVDDRARCLAALDGDWIGLRAITVDAAHRRQGLGLAVVDALLDWGAERGARTAYLQVLGENRPALALYERLGFVEHHRYVYLAR